MKSIRCFWMKMTVRVQAKTSPIWPILTSGLKMTSVCSNLAVYRTADLTPLMSCLWMTSKNNKMTTSPWISPSIKWNQLTLQPRKRPPLPHLWLKQKQRLASRQFLSRALRWRRREWMLWRKRRTSKKWSVSLRMRRKLRYQKKPHSNHPSSRLTHNVNFCFTRPLNKS